MSESIVAVSPASDPLDITNELIFLESPQLLDEYRTAVGISDGKNLIKALTVFSDKEQRLKNGGSVSRVQDKEEDAKYLELYSKLLIVLIEELNAGLARYLEQKHRENVAIEITSLTFDHSLNLGAKVGYDITLNMKPNLPFGNREESTYLYSIMDALLGKDSAYPMQEDDKSSYSLRIDSEKLIRVLSFVDVVRGNLRKKCDEVLTSN